MALTLRVLGARDVGVIPQFEFYPGEEVTLRLQVMDIDSGFPVTIPDAATKTLTLHSDPNDLEIEDGDIDVDADDASIFTVTLDEDTTEDLISGDVQFQYVNSGVTRVAILESGIKRLTTSFE